MLSKKIIKDAIRYKIINKKKKPLCDYHGICENLAYKEVYPKLGSKKKSGWSSQSRAFG